MKIHQSKIPERKNERDAKTSPIGLPGVAIRTTPPSVESGVSNVPCKGPFGPGASRKISEKVAFTDVWFTDEHALKRAIEAIVFTDDIPLRASAAYQPIDIIQIDNTDYSISLMPSGNTGSTSLSTVACSIQRITIGTPLDSTPCTISF